MIKFRKLISAACASVLLLAACMPQQLPNPTLLTDIKASSLPVQAAPVVNSPKPAAQGTVEIKDNRVVMRLQLPPLPQHFQTQKLDLSTAAKVLATVLDSAGHTYTPVGADGQGKVAYPVSGNLVLTFNNVVPNGLLLIETQIEDSSAAIPQANLAVVLSHMSVTHPATAELSFRHTPTAQAVKALMQSGAPGLATARGLNLADLQTFMDMVTAASGSSTGTTYAQNHPSLVNTALLATDLASTPIASLIAANYRRNGASVNVTVAGLVASDQAEVQVTDAATAIVSNLGNGLRAFTGATPGAGLKVLGRSAGAPGTSYTFSASPSSLSLGEGGSQGVTLTATPATPSISTCLPNPAPLGSSVRITGTHFHTVVAGNSVTIGGQPATVTGVNPGGSQLTVTLPSLSSGSHDVVVSVGSASSVPASLQIGAGVALISTVAGAETNIGDGLAATNAAHNIPNDVAIDSSGNLYISDKAHQRVRKRTTSGIISTIAGSGETGYNGEGVATSKQFNNLSSVAVDSSGNVYIADTENQRVRKVTPAGVISTIAGTGTSGYNGEGTATNAQLRNPSAVAVDASGNVYIADTTNGRIRKVTPAGIISTFAGTGTNGYSGEGVATARRVSFPKGLAFDSSGNLYIADTSGDRIRKVTPAGMISTIAGTGTAGYNGEGTATSTQLNDPAGVAVDASGNVYIADTGNYRIRKVTPAGVISTIAGTGTAGYNGEGTGATARMLNYPEGIAADSSGNVYIADSYNFRIRKLTPTGTISTISGGGSADGVQATDSRLSYPRGLVFDDNGNMYIADTDNNRIRKVDAATGIISTFAGTGIVNTDYGYNEVGVATESNVLSPFSLAFDSSGNLYIADVGNNRIRKVTPAGIISTFAGTGTAGYNGEGHATDIQLNSPRGVAFDSNGNLYIADQDNHRIRKVTPAGMTSTVAGTGTDGYNGEGSATDSNLFFPCGVAIDSNGNLIIADQTNNRVRKVTPAGIISTIAGSGGYGYDGEGIATDRQLGTPNSLAIDSNGNVFISDPGNLRVRKVTPAGVISTVAGTGAEGYNGEGIATDRNLFFPTAVAFDSNGSLFISEAYTGRVRKVSY